MKSTKKIIIEVPAELHYEFKLLALKKQTSMTKILIKCMTEEIEKHAKQNQKND
jgi:hypothetical protein